MAGGHGFPCFTYLMNDPNPSIVDVVEDMPIMGFHLLKFKPIFQICPNPNREPSME
jgi:hypothetical protein